MWIPQLFVPSSHPRQGLYMKTLHVHSQLCRKTKSTSSYQGQFRNEERPAGLAGVFTSSTAYARPFMDFSKYWHADEVQMYSDAAKKASLGFGAICGNSWSFSIWGECIQKLDPSIEFLELFAVLVVVLNWVHRYRNR